MKIKDKNNSLVGYLFLILAKTQDYRFRLALAAFLREQFPILNAEVMYWKTHYVEVVTVNRLHKRATNPLNSICILMLRKKMKVLKQ